MRGLVVSILTLILSAAAWGASRDQLLFPPELFRSNDVEIGQWVEYDVTWADGDVEMVKFSIVGTKAESDEPDARKLFWLEAKYAPKEDTEGGARQLFRALVWPADYAGGQMPLPARYIISMAPGTAADFNPEKVLDAVAFLIGPARASTKHWVQDHTAWMAGATPSEGMQTVETPAGSFECKVLRPGEADGSEAYICDKVPFWGVVKLRAPVRGWGVPMTMVLTGFGTDAKSDIDSAIVNVDPLLLPEGPPSEREGGGGETGEGQ
jgi:hypothetical protein